MPDIVCLGILVADVVGRPVDRWPRRGQLVLVDTMETHIGGCAANTGVGLARMGIDTAVAGKVGDDGFSSFVVDRLAAEGLDTSGIVRDPGVPTSSTMVVVHSDGERSFIHCLGANAALQPDDFSAELLTSPRLLHIAGAFLMPGFDGEPTAEVLRVARQAGVTTCLDTAWDSTGKWMKTLQPCLPLLDYCVPSLDEAQAITGRREPPDIAQCLLDHGVGVAAVKLGEDGCYVRGAEGEVWAPPLDIDAVDATGAGDSWSAGFLTGVLNGWDLERTARFANAVGACCVTRVGATTGLRSLEETLEFMERHS